MNRVYFSVYVFGCVNIIDLEDQVNPIDASFENDKDKIKLNLIISRSS